MPGMTLAGLRAGAKAKGYKLVKGQSLIGAMGMRTKTKMQMGGSVVNPIQPVYNPTQADQQRQRNMMEMRQSKPKKDPKMMGTAPPTMGMSKGGKLKDVAAPKNIKNTISINLFFNNLVNF